MATWQDFRSVRYSLITPLNFHITAIRYWEAAFTGLRSIQLVFCRCVLCSCVNFPTHISLDNYSRRTLSSSWSKNQYLRAHQLVPGYSERSQLYAISSGDYFFLHTRSSFSHSSEYQNIKHLTRKYINSKEYKVPTKCIIWFVKIVQKKLLITLICVIPRYLVSKRESLSVFAARFHTKLQEKMWSRYLCPQFWFMWEVWFLRSAKVFNLKKLNHLKYNNWM